MFATTRPVGCSSEKAAATVREMYPCVDCVVTNDRTCGITSIIDAARSTGAKEHEEQELLEL